MCGDYNPRREKRYVEVDINSNNIYNIRLHNPSFQKSIG